MRGPLRDPERTAPTRDADYVDGHRFIDQDTFDIPRESRTRGKSDGRTQELAGQRDALGAGEFRGVGWVRHWSTPCPLRCDDGAGPEFPFPEHGE